MNAETWTVRGRRCGRAGDRHAMGELAALATGTAEVEETAREAFAAGEAIPLKNSPSRPRPTGGPLTRAGCTWRRSMF